MKQKITITGPIVHDVGYRVFLLDEALSLDFENFNAYNKIKDGQQIVEVLLEGDENQITEFKEFAEINCPPLAKVTSVKSEDFEGRVMDIDRYLHVIQITQLQKGITSLQSIDGKQDQMLDKQDQMLDKQDQMLDKQDETIEEIRRTRGDMISGNDGRLVRIEKDVRAIKTRLGIR